MNTKRQQAEQLERITIRYSSFFEQYFVEEEIHNVQNILMSFDQREDAQQIFPLVRRSGETYFTWICRIGKDDDQLAEELLKLAKERASAEKENLELEAERDEFDTHSETVAALPTFDDAVARMTCEHKEWSGAICRGCGEHFVNIAEPQGQRERESRVLLQQRLDVADYRARQAYQSQLTEIVFHYDGTSSVDQPWLAYEIEGMKSDARWQARLAVTTPQ